MNLQTLGNFSDIIRSQGRLRPDGLFLEDIKTERRYTFLEFDGFVEKSARFLQSKGVQKGNIITAVLSNSPEYCFLYFASLRIGAVFNPMPYSSHAAEVRKNISMVEPSLVLIESKREKEFNDNEKNVLFIPVGKERHFEHRLEAYADADPLHIPLDENAPACLYYSSGTTSDPKGVLFSHRNMVSNIASLCRGFRFAEDNEIHLSFLPLGHTAAINYSFLPCAYIGGTIVLAEDFWDIRHRIWHLIETHGVTYFETVPTVLYSLLNIYREGTDQDISSIRFVGCGSAPLQKNIQIAFEKRFGLKVANLYGLSETGPTHVDYPLEPGWQAGSIGVPLDVNEVKIFCEDGQECEPGRTGEIAIKGENVFPGYFKNDILYKKVVRDGFFYTGDLGYKDDEGKFHFVERQKDIIIKGGINIMPGEIDEVLMQHPAVKEGVTVGVNDELFGEDIHSFVVLKKGKLASQEELVEFCSRFLSKFKVPKRIFVVQDIPKTLSGKLLRKELRNISLVEVEDDDSG